MVYVALLRGINVGGNRKVNMKELKVTFEKAGMENVTTYINSGNVIFSTNVLDQHKLTIVLEKAIENSFGFAVKVLLCSIDSMRAIVKTLPDSWQNNSDVKCDVMFLWEHFDNSSVVEQLTIKPRIDDVKYVEGALLWRVDRSNVTRSGMLKIIGTELYRHMTIRNCNTTRKLLGLMQTY